jgi:hypothetical protein
MVNAPQGEALRSAVAALRLKDIVLHAARFSQPTLFDGKVDAHEFVKRAVGYQRTPGDKGSYESLEVHVELGERITAAPNAKAAIYVEIEADFIASYEIRAKVSDEAIKAFAAYNAVHNVWPFWRQHVFDIVNRAHLFHIDIPLFSGNPPGGVRVSESKFSTRSPAVANKTRRGRQVRVRKKA